MRFRKSPEVAVCGSLIKTERPNEEIDCGGLGGGNAHGTQRSAIFGGLLLSSLLASLLFLPSLLPAAATSASAPVRLLRHSAWRDLLAKFNPEPGDFSHENVRLRSGCVWSLYKEP